ncbi:glycoside hydrolase family 74 protein [Collybiopsis luxurians FD-317 M1]|nr:glycoside hydrolase family 74 protein [Collybiopsis luxurians FD-317 M1]
MHKFKLLTLVVSAATSLAFAVSTQSYTWANVKIGGGGGFGLAYARTDIGGAYRLNSDDSWTPLLDFANNTHWNYWGVDALATDPVNTNNLYLATGMYTNSFDPNNGQILISNDQGNTFTVSPLPFKVGGNMPGRGMGERLAVDPNLNSIIFFGARSGHGLWKSTNSAKTWTQVTNFPSVGTYIPDPTDPTGYNSDIIGIAWVTFDATSGTSGKATPRIFVGVANMGSNNVFVTEDGGNTWAAVPGQNNTFLPHKGVLSPAESTLYVSYSNGAGPYDGTLGSVQKYNIATSTWTDITPVSGSDLYFGFGGLAVDLQKPGTIMVAALNSPDGQIFRSTDSGATWSPLWEWISYPTLAKFYTYSDSLAPWIGPNSVDLTVGDLQIGWMMEGKYGDCISLLSLVIDPFDSNHWLYGTGETIYGGHDLTSWDSEHLVTIESLANGVEEMSVQNIVAPPTGPLLLSVVGDDGGFVHTSLTTPPSQEFQTPKWSTAADIDYAGNFPTDFVRIGADTGRVYHDPSLLPFALDSGTSWNIDFGAALNVTGGHVAYSANADTVLWSSNTNGVLVSQFTNAFTAVSSLPSGSLIASDKRNNAIFYAASGANFYLSTDIGHTFTKVSTLGSSTTPAKIVAHPSVSGDVWVSTDKGLFHSTNNGTTFTTISGVTQAWAFALGAPATTGGYPSLYAGANIGGTIGYFRTDDEGTNWVQINDAAHGFGSVSSNPITADQRVYGRVFIGTNGRGIWYGTPG